MTGEREEAMTEEASDLGTSPAPQDLGTLPLERLHELVELVKESGPEDVGWELGVHLEGVEEAAKEYSVRVRSLEQENRQLEDRLTRGHEQYEQLRESMNELLNLHQLSETISTSFRIEDILDALMDLSNRFVPYETCGMFVLEEEGNKLEVGASRGMDVPTLQARVQSHWEDGIIDWVMRERRPVVIDDIDVLSRESSDPHCFVMIPLIVGGKKVGIFILHCAREKDDFTLGQVQLLDVLANQTAAAVSNSRHYSDLESTHDQLVESQQQLLISAKQAAIGELAGGVAHEVNNPLQIILSRVQLMIAQNTDAEPVIKGLRLIESNVRRISKIIRALLGFAGHNKAGAEWSLFDLNQAIQQAIALVKHQLDAQSIEVDIEIAEDLPALLGNVGELEQVFINLMLNAQYAMPKGGNLRITARLDGEEVDLRFADSGEGVPPEHEDRLFEPFFTTRADEGGTGLGLAVSYSIVGMHKGSLSISSEVEQGATFVIRLPVPPSASAPAGTSSDAGGVSEGEYIDIDTELEGDPHKPLHVDG